MNLLLEPRLMAILVLAVALALVLLLAGVAAAYGIGRTRGRQETEAGLPLRLTGEREDAVRRSRAALSGLAAEQLAPWLPGFPWDPAEARFVGRPIDFIVFAGSSSGDIAEVVFVEVKTGRSSLSRVERSLRDAVRDGRVRWEEYRPPEPPLRS